MMKRENELIKNQWFNGTLDAKKAFHAIVGNSEIDSDVIQKLWQYRQFGNQGNVSVIERMVIR